MGAFNVKSSGPERELVPQGTHLARLVGLYDLGTQADSQYGAKRQVLLSWEVIGRKNKIGGVFLLSKFYSFSFAEKSNLRRDVCSWTGRSFGSEDDFDIETLFAVPCQIAVSHKPKKLGGWREDIQAITGLPEGLGCPDPVSDLTVYGPVDPSIPLDSAVPKWIAEKVMDSAEWVKVHGPRQISNQPASASPGPGKGFANLRPQTNGTPQPEMSWTATNAPAEIQPLMEKYMIGWTYSLDELEGRKEDIAPKDYAILAEHAIPF